MGYFRQREVPLRVLPATMRRACAASGPPSACASVLAIRTWFMTHAMVVTAQCTSHRHEGQPAPLGPARCHICCHWRWGSGFALVQCCCHWLQQQPSLQPSPAAAAPPRPACRALGPRGWLPDATRLRGPTGRGGARLAAHSAGAPEPRCRPACHAAVPRAAAGARVRCPLQALPGWEGEGAARGPPCRSQRRRRRRRRPCPAWRQPCPCQM